LPQRPRPRGENNIDLESDELGRDLGKAFGAPVRPANLDCDVSALGPVEFTQPLHKSGGPWAPGRRRGRAQEPDGFQLCWLLRARRERPRGRRAAEQRDEVAALHIGHQVSSRLGVDSRSIARPTCRRKAGKSLGQT